MKREDIRERRRKDANNKSRKANERGDDLILADRDREG